MPEMNEKLEILKIMAHPVRIKVLQELLNGVKCVSDFQEFLGISQPNVSQHLSLLRAHGIVDFYVDGRLKCYFLVHPLIPDILEVLQKDHDGPLPGPECCPVTKKGTYPGERRR